MNERMAVDVVIVNFNGANTILHTINSLQQQTGVATNIVVVDDGSTDNSLSMVRDTFPAVKVVEQLVNSKEVNRLRNEGIRSGSSDYVFVTDNDLHFQADCLLTLARSLASNTELAMCIPTLLYWDDEDKIYAAGSKIHFSGATTDSHRGASLEHSGQLFSHSDGNSLYRDAIGGGIALFKRSALAQVGLFDEDYSLAWGDDGELHQRLLLAGYKARCIFNAHCFHEEKEFDSTRTYRGVGQVRNRILFVLSYYSPEALLLTGPILITQEMVQFIFMGLKGLTRQYFEGLSAGLRLLPLILKKRRMVQSLRRVPDSMLLHCGLLAVAPTTGGGGKLPALLVRGLSLFYSCYWFLVRPFLSLRKKRPPKVQL